MTLIKKNEANAFCLPGGKIVVYTGIVPLTENGAGLATVLGHEVAHATAEHVAERIERNHLTEVATTIHRWGRRLHAGAVPADPGAARRRVESPFQPLAGVRGDHIGLVYMARAGYDPHQAVAFWKRMRRASQGREPPEFLSDHPSDAHRVARVRRWLPEAVRAYKPRT